MPRPFVRYLPAAAAALFLASLAGEAVAQGAAPLPSMPMPPSASDPAPKESGRKAQPRKATTKKKTSEDATDGAAPAATRRTGNTASRESFERPKRYVPDEFDRGGDGDPRAKPFMSESGRPGMGMRF